MHVLVPLTQDPQATRLADLEDHAVGLKESEPVNYSTAKPDREGVLQVQVAVDVEGSHIRT